MDKDPKVRQEAKPPDPDKVSYASAAKDKSKQIRGFANLIENAKNERNKIEIKFTKLKNSPESDKSARYIDLEIIREYIFTILKIKPEDVLEINLNSGRYDTKQILLKPEVDTDKLISDFPDTYGGFSVNVSKLTIKRQR